MSKIEEALIEYFGERCGSAFCAGSATSVQTGATKMTKHKKVAPDPLLDALTDELIAMTDEQVLAGEDPALVLAQGRDLLAKAGADASTASVATS